MKDVLWTGCIFQCFGSLDGAVGTGIRWIDRNHDVGIGLRQQHIWTRLGLSQFLRFSNVNVQVPVTIALCMTHTHTHT